MNNTKTKTDAIVCLAAGIFIGGVIFDVFPKAAKSLGIMPALIWMAIGYVVWWVSKALLNTLKQPALSWLTAAALWFHSILEGIITGLAFGVSETFGLFILAAMTFHILPEFFAAIALMKGAGSTTQKSIWTTCIGFIVLYASFGLTYILIPNLASVLPFAVAISGGAFLFVGLASFWKRKSLANVFALIAGVGIIFLQSTF